MSANMEFLRRFMQKIKKENGKEKVKVFLHSTPAFNIVTKQAISLDVSCIQLQDKSEVVYYYPDEKYFAYVGKPNELFYLSQPHSFDLSPSHLRFLGEALLAKIIEVATTKVNTIYSFPPRKSK